MLTRQMKILPLGLISTAIYLFIYSWFISGRCQYKEYSGD
jgi:hypothetical protein